MDILLLGITVVSLIVALVMSVTAWRLMREEKSRSAARVAALSLAAEEPKASEPLPSSSQQPPSPQLPTAVSEWKPKAPWSPPPAVAVKTAPPELPLNDVRLQPDRVAVPQTTHAAGFLGAAEMTRNDGGRQKGLAFAAVVLFLVLSGGLLWMMSDARGTTAVAMGPNSPLELVSLTHQRQNDKLAVSGLVRNPATGTPVERLSAVVFLFDRTGTFVTSSRANVDFLKLGAGDESPFVVSLDAPPTVARYRVSFRTEEGVVPHVDKREPPPAELKIKS